MDQGSPIISQQGGRRGQQQSTMMTSSPLSNAATAGGTSTVPLPLETAYIPMGSLPSNVVPSPKSEGVLSVSISSSPPGMELEEKERAEQYKNVVQACYIGLAAILGSLIRIVMAQLFGEHCANPGTIGWLAAASPLCVTKDGQFNLEGGIIFSDLPANIVGCFLMGVFQGAAVLSLTVPMAVAWLRPDHPFQKMDILHKAFTTGLCGSLTTFSSWNSEMVVLIFGTANNRQTQIWQALLGYIIGMETAQGSFVCGKSVARRLHRNVNPTLAHEADAAKEKAKEGVPINRELPDFERRYLPNLDMGDDFGMLVPVHQIEPLSKWRTSTESARRVGQPLLPLLTQIESTVLAHCQPYLSSEAESVARAEGWELDALHQWVESKSKDLELLPSVSSGSSGGGARGGVPPSYNPHESIWFTLHVAAAMVGVVYIILFGLLLGLNNHNAHTITYRTMVYAMIFAPAGAILRWRLSKLNGTWAAPGWEWLPLGTLIANVVGSIISIAAVGGEAYFDDLYDSEIFWNVGTIRAVKVGFAGCLTTVSTFAAEVGGFMHGRGKDESGRAYPYILTTLGLSCGLSCVVYGLIVVFAPSHSSSSYESNYDL